MKFVVTGTQVYGPAEESSDLDIVILREDTGLFMDWLIRHNIKPYSTEIQANYGDLGGYYFNLCGIKINIIVAQDKKELAQWKHRTEHMLIFPPIQNREMRLAFFGMKDYPNPKQTREHYYKQTYGEE